MSKRILIGGLKRIWRKSKVIRPAFWDFYSLPRMRALRKELKKIPRKIVKHRTRFALRHILPREYAKYAVEQVDENKIIILDLRLDKPANSFQILIEELGKYDFDVHVHLLHHGFVSTSRYIENCKALMRDMATAKYVFMCESSDVVSCVQLRPETVVTQLWHACGAFKRFGMSTAELLFGPNAKEMKKYPTNRNYSVVTVSSPEIIWAYEEAMDLKDHPGIVQALGTSRTDIFFQEERIKDAYQRIYDEFPAAKGKKIILYAPTFRGRVLRAGAPNKLNVGMIYKMMGDDYVLIIKHHPIVKNLPELPPGLLETFVHDGTRTMSIEDLIMVSDICISDYSSLIFEFALYEKPMLFYAYDLENYFDWRGFYYDYDALTPGPVCKDNLELVQALIEIEDHFDKQSVVDFKNRFMASCDGHATDRILKKVMGENVLNAHKRRK